MKFLHGIHFTVKDIQSRLWLPMLMGTVLTISSCEDETDSLSTSTQISFTPQIHSSWESSARSVDTIPPSTVTILQGSNTPLYLHTLYADSIVADTSANESNAMLLSRAVPVTSTAMYNTFSVSAYAYQGEWNETRTPNYMYNQTASKSDNNYVLPSSYYWPGASYKMKFFAYAPQGNSGYTLSESTQAGTPLLSVTIPAEVSQQQDLLVAQSDEINGDANTAVPLTFQHTLTAIRFVCGSDVQSGTVKSIQLKGVYSKGVYNMGTKTWSELGTVATYTQTLNKATTGTANEEITTDAQTFMMIPQTLPEGAKLEILFTDGSGTDHTLTADLKETVWPMGKTVTYQISTTSINWRYSLNHFVPINDWTYEGGSPYGYFVMSYREGHGRREAVPWTAQFSTDNGVTWTSTPPEWLQYPTSGPGSYILGSFKVTMTPQEGIIGTQFHTDVLKAATPKGTEATPYNLSNKTGASKIENTANCYVINAPGVYSFPLVYGNAIRYEKANPSAYTASSWAKGDNVLKTFLNHAGMEITNPYISKNANCVPAKAELLWQDAPALVTDIKYNNDANGGTISFKVNQESICQGNAVIVLKDDADQVLWSWHIWVTDENLEQTVEMYNGEGEKFKFMPVNLGWCDGNAINYAARSCQVKVTAGPLSRVTTIGHPAKSISFNGNQPYYQWGRKDPFLPASTQSTVVNKTWYDKDGVASNASPSVADLQTGAAAISRFILMPNVMQSKYASDGVYYNLWNTNMTKNTITLKQTKMKTIYDPCPVGFKVASGSAFMGFTRTGKKTDASSVNGDWDASRNGWYLYGNRRSKFGPNLFFPISGIRHFSDGSLKSGTIGASWTEVPAAGIAGHAMIYQEQSVEPAANNRYRSDGLPVRPIRE